MPDIAELYEQHKNQVYRYSYGLLRHQQDAEDVTAQTFETAMQKLEQTEGYERHGSWLLTIARNHINNRWRKKDFVTESEQFAATEDGGFDTLIPQDKPDQLDELI